jgi:hypothetical protein
MEEVKESSLVRLDNSVRSLANPQHVLDVGSMLKSYIVNNSLSTMIQGKQYAHVDAWKFAGMIFGLSAICDEPVRISGKENIYVVYGKRSKNGSSGPYVEEYIIYQSSLRISDDELESLGKSHQISRQLIKEYFNYKCATKIVRLADGVTVSTGFATCSNLESKKVTFDEYAINSMSQTRSIGKGYRNLIGYVMNAAGFESTPAEEMDEMDDAPKQKATSGKGAKRSPVDTTAKEIINDEVKFAKLLSQLKEGVVKYETVIKYYSLTELQDKLAKKAAGIEVKAERKKPEIKKKSPTKKKK